MRRRAPTWPLVAVALAGAAAGACLRVGGGVLAIAAGRSPGLAVLAAFGLLPALLAAGWTAAVLAGRGHRRWPAFAAAAGLVELAIAVGAAEVVAGPLAPLLLGGPAPGTDVTAAERAAGMVVSAQTVDRGLLVMGLAAVAMLVVPVAAALFVPRGPDGRGAGRTIRTGLLWTLSVTWGWFLFGLG